MKGLLAVLTVVLAGAAAFYLMQDASQYGALRLEGRASVALLRDDAPLQATAGPTARSETTGVVAVGAIGLLVCLGRVGL